MSAQTSIQWTDRTWNPIRGCSRVSPGCDNCYAMRVAHRFSSEAGKVSGKPGPYHGLTILRPKTAKRPGVDWLGKVRAVPSALSEPVGWRKPSRVFVNSMSDLFHESLPDSVIDSVFGAMWACLYLGAEGLPGHTFQVLTKRPHRAVEYFATDRREAWAYAAVRTGGGINPDGIYDQTRFFKGPHPRIWLGVSVENQATADERIPLLLKIPAAVRFVSAEPLLESVDLNLDAGYETGGPQGWVDSPRPDWVIVGGESGPGARPCALEWLERIVEQCHAAKVACFVKQLGGFVVSEDRACATAEEAARDFGFKSRWLWRMGTADRKGGDINEFPPELQVREFPGGAR